MVRKSRAIVRHTLHDNVKHALQVGVHDVGMPTIGDRIAEILREDPSKKQSALAEACGVTRASVSDWISGKSKTLKPENLVAAADYLGVELRWLANGTGPKHSIYRITEAPAKFEIREPENVEVGPNIRGSVPLVSWVAAGDFEPASDPFEPGVAEDWFPCPVSHSKYTYALRVRGDSMAPEYKDGEIIFVDPMLEPKHGDDVIVKLIDREETTFKQLRVEGRHSYLKPLNPAWPEQIIEINEKAFFKGVVIFSGRKRRR